MCELFMAEILFDSLVRRKHETNLQCESLRRTTELLPSEMSLSVKTGKAVAVLEPGRGKSRDSQRVGQS